MDEDVANASWTPTGFEQNSTPASSEFTSFQSDPPNDATWILTSTFIIFTMQSGGPISSTGLVYDPTDPADDAVWILTSTFIIFTMQSGFGLLESGSVTTKNEVNIMVKNAVDVIIGGFSYWMFGYAISFGIDECCSNDFNGWGYFFVSVNDSDIGEIYPHFFFQSSFATTATTIVSGAMAERTKLEAYIVFSFFNTLVFCFPAHWVWSDRGFLRKLGFMDIAGDGPVHLVGGITGLVSTLLLKPRYGRYETETSAPPPMGSPTNALLGMFMLWWGWLGFNCGSTFGISGYKWKLAARSAVATLCASIGGGCVALTLSYFVKKKKFDVGFMINGILASLVAVTGLCALAQPWEGFIIGAVGALVGLAGISGLDRLHIDDPVGCVGVHALGATWGLIAVGLFARKDILRSGLDIHHQHVGLFYGGGWYLLGVQVAGIFIIATWTFLLAFFLLKCVDITVGLRVSLQHEILGADLIEHAVGDLAFDKKTNSIINLRRNSSFNRKSRRNHESGNDNNPGDSSFGPGSLPSIPEFNQAHKRRRATMYTDSLLRMKEFNDLFVPHGTQDRHRDPDGAPAIDVINSNTSDKLPHKRGWFSTKRTMPDEITAQEKELRNKNIQLLDGEVDQVQGVKNSSSNAQYNLGFSHRDSVDFDVNRNPSLSSTINLNPLNLHNEDREDQTIDEESFSDELEEKENHRGFREYHSDVFTLPSSETHVSRDIKSIYSVNNGFAGENLPIRRRKEVQDDTFPSPSDQKPDSASTSGVSSDAFHHLDDDEALGTMSVYI